MSTIKEIHKLIEINSSDIKQHVWDTLVREIIGCQFCQYYDKRKKRCKNGINILLKSNGILCNEILPTKID